MVAGPVNTYQLARKADADKLKTVRDLYPVVPGDSRLQKPDDRPEATFALHFPLKDKGPAFLKLDPDGKGPLAGWDEFFFGNREEHKENDLERGFYAAYPVEALKPAATVLAAFADPKAKLADGDEAPFLAEQVARQGPRRLPRLRRDVAAAPVPRGVPRRLLDGADPVRRAVAQASSGYFRAATA